MPSDLQVFVRWKEQTVFAGEDLECTITFKNVSAEEAQGQGDSSQQPQPPRGNATRPVNGSANGDYFSPKSISRFLPNSRRPFPLRPQGRPQPPAGRTHRVSSSLSTPIASNQGFPPLSEKNRGPPPPGHRHKRSVSIISLDNDGKERKPGHPQFNKHVPPRGHGRSASLQVFSKRNDSYNDGPQTGMT